MRRSTATESVRTRTKTDPSVALQILAIMRKDLLLELRSRETVSLGAFFGLLAMVIFSFAFELRVENAAALSPGVLWVAFAFAGVLSLGRIFIRERDQGCMEGILAAPVPRGAIYLAKALAGLFFMGLVEVLVLPVFGLLFNVGVFHPGIAMTVLLGSAGFASVGTLFAAMAIHARAREAMLPILLLPVAIPVVIAVVKATGLVLDGKGLEAYLPWLQLLLAFDIVFIAACYGLAEYVLDSPAR